ncbi:MAG TPA: carboxypeptidase-like regulatory domain-containing protein, partial [Verrucomicrobiae bacterium]
MSKRAVWAFALSGFAFAATICSGQEASRDKTLEVDKQVAAIVADWEALPGVFDDVEIYSAQIKKLVEIGPAAVPALCMELDRTTRGMPMRLIPFTLRAIGDARAVPALIRAIPRTLQLSSSDCGASVSPPELMSFMQSNDVAAAEGWDRNRSDFDIARPVREVTSALHKITGNRLNENDVMFTFLDGGELQRALQKKAFHDVAQNWARWWEKNWNRFGQDRAFADVRLPAFKDEIAAKRDDSQKGILTGPNIRVTGGSSGATLSPIESGRQCALQLALHRTIDLPSDLKETAANTSFENIATWAERADIDLLGAQYREPISGNSFYCLRAVGLQAWEIDNNQWDGIEQTLQSGKAPELKRPVTDFLMHYDANERRYMPEKKATFVFITREGLQGILRITAQVTKPINPASFGIPYTKPDESGADQRIENGFEKGIRFDHRFFYTDTEAFKREELARQEDRAARQETHRKKKLARLFEANPTISGTVFLPDGTIARNASVALGMPEAATTLGARKFEFPEQTTIVEAGDDGKFLLPHVPTAHHIYVAHEKGFAEVSLSDAKSPLSVHLRPWGRIEGTLIRQGKPVAGEKVVVYVPSRGENWELTLGLDAFSATTDPEGKFAFENLPAGEFHIVRVVGNRFHEAQIVEVEAGKTTVFEHVLNGRNLKGRFVASSGAKADWLDARNFRFNRKQSLPQNYAEISAIAALPIEHRQAARASFPVRVEPDGQFEIKNVPAGVYEFRGELREGGEEPFRFGKVLGRLNREVVISDAAGPEGEAVSLGDLAVEMT